MTDVKLRVDNISSCFYQNYVGSGLIIFGIFQFDKNLCFISGPNHDKLTEQELDILESEIKGFDDIYK